VLSSSFSDSIIDSRDEISCTLNTIKLFAHTFAKLLFYTCANHTHYLISCMRTSVKLNTNIVKLYTP
jgi:hypothetical protein